PPCVVHCWSDEAAAALARGDASSGAHAPHKRHHTAYGGLRWPDNDVQLMPLGRLCVDYLSGARNSYGVQNPPEPSYGDDQHPARTTRGETLCTAAAWRIDVTV